ncbi:hypothetical protein JOB18_021233 [Solea senegalensis]|uniref:Uncharacterized protein n=1 Tax=Solea senegalensis TaxID=28829 RepID=A0AAV6SKK3_SOLSE|nr:hypothetical protein JOB18_021233 [Solea senegalensis]
MRLPCSPTISQRLKTQHSCERPQVAINSQAAFSKFIVSRQLQRMDACECGDSGEAAVNLSSCRCAPNLHCLDAFMLMFRFIS